VTAKLHKAVKGIPKTADTLLRRAMAPDSDMNGSGSQFVENEIRETETADPGARILCFEGRDLRDSMPMAPLETGEGECYDLICVDNLLDMDNLLDVDNLAEKIRNNGRARELLAELFCALSPGGRLLVGGSTEADEEELAHLSTRIPEHEIAGQVVVRDQAGEAIFLEVYRRAA
jgi:hypothetical protein